MYEIHGIPPEKKKSVLLMTYPSAGMGWQLAQKKSARLEEQGYLELKVIESKNKSAN